MVEVRVDHGGGDYIVAEHLAPGRTAVGYNDRAGPFVAGRNQLEQAGGLRLEHGRAGAGRAVSGRRPQKLDQTCGT